ncbi:MAG: hypothetical protein HZA46_23135 [Planctomycetales bacterium]|nr:hypothetical protein [Planctomycetales bacterium]
MAYFGLLTLGAFIGTILLGGLQFAKNLDAFKKVVTYLFSSAFAGTLMTFFNYLAKEHGVQNFAHAVFMYPVGLFMALVFSFLPDSLKVIGAPKDQHTESSVQLAWCHIGLLGIATLVLCVMVLPPAFCVAWANLNLAPAVPAQATPAVTAQE